MFPSDALSYLYSDKSALVVLPGIVVLLYNSTKLAMNIKCFLYQTTVKLVMFILIYWLSNGNIDLYIWYYNSKVSIRSLAFGLPGMFDMILTL